MTALPRISDRAGLPPVLLLVAAYVVAFAQRQTPAILAPALAAQLRIDDDRLGLLHGPSFALSYGVLAVLGGRLVDRRRRVSLLAGGLALASLATAASAFATDLATLALLRVLVGIGQATLVPATYSLIGDWTPARRSGRATAMLACGPFVGAGSMALAGGAVSSVADWPAGFLVAGGTGLLVAVAIGRLPEPTRTRMRQEGGGFARHLRARWPAILVVLAAMVCNAAAGQILFGWATTWLVRSRGIGPGVAAGLFGAILLLGGVAGTLAAGATGDALVRRGRSRLILLAAAALTGALAASLAFGMGAALPAEALLAATVFCVAAAIAIGPAALQEITPPAMRGRQHGIAVLLINLIGTAGAPWIVGQRSALTGDPVALDGVLAVSVPTLLGVSALVALFGARAQGQAATPRQATAPGRPSSIA